MLCASSRRRWLLGGLFCAALGFVTVASACGSNGASAPPPAAEAGADTGIGTTDAGNDDVANDDAAEDASEDWLAPPPNLPRLGEGQLGPLRQACAFDAGAWAAQTVGSEYPLGSDIPINHVLVIMQENRSFDHYLGRLVAQGFYNAGDFTVVPDGGVDGGDAGDAASSASDGDGGNAGADAGGLGAPGSGFSHSDQVDVPPPGWSNPDGDGGTIYPHPDDEYCFSVNHDWVTMHNGWDNGKNDGFVTANNPDGARTFFYEDDTIIPFYYALASTFSVGDRYFCSVLGPTWPNRIYMMAATSFGKGNDNSAVAGNVSQIFSLLEAAGRSWKDYTDGLHMELMLRDFGFSPDALAHYGNVKCNLFADIASGSLPDVAFMDGDEQIVSGQPTASEYSDEGPSDLAQIGAQLVEQIIRALWASGSWKDTAVFITRDENGGMADHVPPAPACEPDGLSPLDTNGSPLPGAFNTTGFRVPFIVVSPYARAHFVSHTVYDHTSILRFIEARFGLPALTARDANAATPMDMFDFQNPPFMTPPTIAATTTVPPAILAQCQQTLPPTCSQ